MKELRGEATQRNADENRRPDGAEILLTDHEKRHKERREGLPPPWTPTIFLKEPTNSEIDRRFRPTRSGRGTVLDPI